MRAACVAQASVIAASWSRRRPPSRESVTRKRTRRTLLYESTVCATPQEQVNGEATLRPSGTDIVAAASCSAAPLAISDGCERDGPRGKSRSGMTSSTPTMVSVTLVSPSVHLERVRDGARPGKSRLHLRAGGSNRAVGTSGDGLRRERLCHANRCRTRRSMRQPAFAHYSSKPRGFQHLSVHLDRVLHRAGPGKSRFHLAAGGATHLLAASLV
jgi:hypothetical protein